MMEIESLTVFSSIRDDRAITGFTDMLRAVDEKDTAAAVRHYSEFVSQLYHETASLTDYIRTLVLQDDNFYVKNSAAGMHRDHEIEVAMESERMILQELASLKASSVRDFIGYDGYLPSWTVRQIDLQYDFMEKLSNISRTGYGTYAKYNILRMEEGEIVPVAHLEYTRFDVMVGYEK